MLLSDFQHLNSKRKYLHGHRKIVAFFLIVLFGVQQVIFSPCLHAKTRENLQNQSFDKISLSSNTGIITNHFENTQSPITIFLIEDIHCNFEAQLKISKIVAELSKRCGASLVFAEGAKGSVQTDLFGTFPDQKVRERVSRKFLKKGFLTGPEYLAIAHFDDLPLKIYGIEDEKLYLENDMAFKKVYKRRESTKRFIKKLSSLIETLKQKYFSQELLVLDQSVQNYQNGKITLMDYLHQLDEIGLDPQKYPHLALLLKTLGSQDKASNLRLEKEQEQFLNQLSHVLNQEDMRGLIKMNLMMKLNKITPQEYFQFLRSVVPEHCVDEFHRSFPHCFQFFDGMSLQTEKHEILTSELETAGASLLAGLARTDEEKTVLQFSENLNLLSRIFTLTLSREEVEKYGEGVNLADYFSQVKSFLRKAGIPDSMNDLSPRFIESLKQVVQSGKDFYSAALKREKAFVENTLQKIREEKIQKVILITGGFHSEAMFRLFKDRGISCVTIVPILHNRVDPHLYVQRMLQQTIKVSSFQEILPAHLSLLDLLSDLRLNESDSAGFMRAMFREFVLTCASNTGYRDDEILFFWEEILKTMHPDLLPSFRAQALRLLAVAKIVHKGDIASWSLIQAAHSDPEKTMEAKIVLAFLAQEDVRRYGILKQNIKNPQLLAYTRALDKILRVSGFARTPIIFLLDPLHEENSESSPVEEDEVYTLNLGGTNQANGSNQEPLGTVSLSDTGDQSVPTKRGVNLASALKIVRILSQFCEANPKNEYRLHRYQKEDAVHFRFQGQHLITVTWKARNSTFLTNPNASFEILSDQCVRVRFDDECYTFTSKGTVEVVSIPDPHEMALGVGGSAFFDFVDWDETVYRLRSEISRLKDITLSGAGDRYLRRLAAFIRYRHSQGEPLGEAVAGAFLDEIDENLNDRPRNPGELYHSSLMLDELRKRILSLGLLRDVSKDKFSFRGQPLQVQGEHIMTFLGYPLLSHTGSDVFIDDASVQDAMITLIDTGISLLNRIILGENSDENIESTMAEIYELIELRRQEPFWNNIDQEKNTAGYLMNRAAHAGIESLLEIHPKITKRDNDASISMIRQLLSKTLDPLGPRRMDKLAENFDDIIKDQITENLSSLVGYFCYKSRNDGGGLSGASAAQCVRPVVRDFVEKNFRVHAVDHPAGCYAISIGPIQLLRTLNGDLIHGRWEVCFSSEDVTAILANVSFDLYEGVTRSETPRQREGDPEAYIRKGSQAMQTGVEQLAPISYTQWSAHETQAQTPQFFNEARRSMTQGQVMHQTMIRNLEAGLVHGLISLEEGKKVREALEDLKDPEKFLFFQSKVWNREDYFLGAKNALAVDVMEFIGFLGGGSALCEYLFHESFEGKLEGDETQRHQRARAIQAVLFEGVNYREGKVNVLGLLLRVFIDIQSADFVSETVPSVSHGPELRKKMGGPSDSRWTDTSA